MIVSKSRFNTKGTLMQICKSPYMFVFVWKYPEDFTFLILRILVLFACEDCKFLKSRPIFILFYCFWM